MCVSFASLCNTHFDVTVESLIELNDLPTENDIQVGQVLEIPDLTADEP